MLGLRPRLRTRPSLLNLIQRHHLITPQLTPQASEFPLDEEVGLDFPFLQPLDNLRSKPRTTFTLASTALIPLIAVMAPSRKDAEADEDHSGTVYSVSGPVIIAENMIGCAMYELVRLCHGILRYKSCSNLTRSKSAMKSLQEKLFGLKPIRQPSKSTRRLVWITTIQRLFATNTSSS